MVSQLTSYSREQSCGLHFNFYLCSLLLPDCTKVSNRCNFDQQRYLISADLTKYYSDKCCGSFYILSSHVIREGIIIKKGKGGEAIGI